MDQQLAFLKRHGFVIAGVGLPILVVLAFALARLAPRYYVEDPRYELVYSVAGAYSSTQSDRVCDLAAVDGRLRVRWTQLEQAGYMETPRAFRLDAASGELVELVLPEAGDLAQAGGHVEFIVEGLEDVGLDPSLRAPDGYEFESSYRGGGGLFGELFFQGPSGTRTTVHKRGRRIDVPHPRDDDYGYETVTFLGWAIPREDGE